MSRLMSRAMSRAIARLLACVLVLAQLSIAAYACPGLRSTSAGAAAAAAAALRHQAEVAGNADSASAASSAASADSAASSAMPGCQGMAATLDPAAANLCAEHCKIGQQSHEVPTVPVPMAVLTALYALPSVLVEGPPPRPAAATIDALVAASPPLAVLHCVYRT